MKTPWPYGNQSHSTEFLVAQFHRFVFLRWGLEDLLLFAKSSEQIIEERQLQAQEEGVSPISPFIVRGSIVVMLCGVLESFLTDICNVLHKIEGYSVGPDDLRGSGIQRAQAYIKKIAALPFPDEGKEWAQVLALFRVRNAIVHGGGRLSTAADIDKAKQVPYVEVNESGEVWLERGTIEAAIAIVSAFVDSLEKKIAGPKGKQYIERGRSL